MTPSHTRKQGRILRYYISNRLIRRKDPSGWRLSAAKLEDAVAALLLTHPETVVRERPLSSMSDETPHQIVARQKQIQDWQDAVRRQEPDALCRLYALPRRIDIGKGHVNVIVDKSTLAAICEAPEDAFHEEWLIITAPFNLRRRGVEARIIMGEPKPAPDLPLQRALARAHLWAEALKKGTPLTKIASDAHVSPGLIRTRLPLAFLSPKIQAAIMAGTQPPDLTLAKLIRLNLPYDWRAQEEQVGI